MRKLVTYLCIFVLVALVPTLVCAQTNLLVNPGFESGGGPNAPPWIIGWWGGGGQAVKTVFHTGARSWEVDGTTPDSDYPAVLQPNITVSPDKYYVMKAWVKIPDASPTNPRWISQEYGYGGGGAIYVDLGEQTLETPDWVQLVTPMFKFPPGLTLLDYYCVYTDLGFIYYVDDCELLEYTPHKIGGTVTSGGAPLAGALVAASFTAPAFNGPLAVATTGADGTYSLYVPNGTWYVASKASRYSLSERPTPVVVSGSDVSGINFELSYVGIHKLIELKTDDLVVGDYVFTWPNTGTLGGTFEWGMTGAPMVEEVDGKKAVTLLGQEGDCYMVASFNSPPEICYDGAWSVAFWAYNPTVEEGIETVIGWGQRGADAQLCQIGYGANYPWSAGAHWGWYDIGFDSGTPAAAQWHLICLTFDGAEERVYADGLLNSTEEKILQIFPDQPFYLGCYHEPDMTTRIEYYSGSLASVEVYDAALTEAEVRELAGMTPIAEIITKPDETEVTVSAPITLAPKDRSGVQKSYLYLEDPDRTAAIRVESASSFDANAGGAAMVKGLLKTNAAGERYILTNAPSILVIGDPNAFVPAGPKPFGVNTKSVQEDSKTVARLVTVGGTIRTIAGDKSFFTIADGYYKDGSEVETKVVIEGRSKIGWFNVGDFVQVIGVVSKASAATKVVIYRDIVTKSWKCGFEPEEGYALGDVNGQNGWVLGWNPRDLVAPATVSNERAASGTQSLKCDVPNSYAGYWWENLFCLDSPPAIPNVPMKSATVKMKIWRDGGTTVYKTKTYPNVWFNQIGWYPWNRYWDFGDDPDTLVNSNTTTLMHAQIYNDTPRRYGDPGWPQIAGRFVGIVVFDDYTNSQRSVWYDGALVADKLAMTGNGLGGGLTIFYGSANPWVDGQILGKPAYIDDIEVSWELR